MVKTAPPFQAICFDCDSTLSSIEGIDELAERAGCAAQIVPLTTAAMEGRLALDEVYGKRLALIRPDRAALDWLGRRYCETVVPGAAEAIDRLRRAGKAVHIVSGGLRQPILELAHMLGVMEADVHAVAALFNEDGSYRGFDTASPLARRGGKAEVVRGLVLRHGAVAMVGDGITDLEAREGGGFVVGFGGVVARAAVMAGADRFVRGPSLEDVVQMLLDETERAGQT